MDKKEIRKLVAGIIITAIIIGVAVYGMIAIMNSGIQAVTLGQGSAAYNNFIDAIIFSKVSSLNTEQGWFLFGATVLFYLGIILFVAALIAIIAKRAIRYIFLPIAGLCAFDLASFTLLAFYECFRGAAAAEAPLAFTWTLLGITIALVVFGLVAFIFGLAFPRRLISKKDDLEAAAPAKKE